MTKDKYFLKVRTRTHLNFRIPHLNMERVRIRIGIATGPLSEFRGQTKFFIFLIIIFLIFSVSCVPTQKRLKFTILGLCVNRAQQLESEVKKLKPSPQSDNFC